MDVNCKIRKSIKNFFADSHAYSRGVQRKLFIGTLCIDLEGLCKHQIILKVFAGGGNYNVHIFFNGRTTGNSRNSEYHFNSSERLIQIDILINRFNDYG